MDHAAELPSPRDADGPTPRLFQHAAVADDAAAVLAAGLSARPAAIPPRFLYDALGARLFEAICELPEYYPTRTEAGILARAAAAIAAHAGPGRVLIDLGAGNCAKAERLFAALRPAQYVAVDLDAELLRPVLGGLQQRHPRLPMVGLGTDLGGPLVLPQVVRGERRLAFYPGSSIGNFDRAGALALLRRVRDVLGADGQLLIGVDLDKPEALLRPAYDDPLQVTAAFNRNLLRHVNRRLGADFALADWAHELRCPPGRVEMHLRALRALTVRWPGGERRFAAGECIHTENSHKHTLEGFRALLATAGFRTVACWTDPQAWFAVFLAAADRDLQ